jgi:hypothetical protein
VRKGFNVLQVAIKMEAGFSAPVGLQIDVWIYQQGRYGGTATDRHALFLVEEIYVNVQLEPPIGTCRDAGSAC